MKTFFSRLLLLLILFAPGIPAAGAESPLSDENIHIKADTMTQGPAAGEVTASGNVVMTWQGMSLVADHARYDNATHVLFATGHVVVSKGSDVMTGETLTMNLESGRAEVDNAIMSVPASNLSVTGLKIIRSSETQYDVTAPELTTCDLPDPSWKFGAEALKVNPSGYATGRNIIFYIKDVPVFYFPWLAFPATRDRKTGLLFPKFGYSASRGYQLDIPLYLVISPSQDALVDFDLLSKRGVGIGLGYRYIRARGSEGHFSGYMIYDTSLDFWRGQISQSHREIFSPDMNLRMDVNYHSDRTFLNDFGEKSGEYNRQSSDTVINVLKTWQHYAASGYLSLVGDLYANNDNATLQTLPALEIAGVRQQLFKTPLYFDIDATVANLYRQTAPSGQRAHLFPRVTYQQSLGGYLQSSFFAGAHVRGYATDRKTAGSGIKNSDGDLVPEVGARLSSSLMRGFDVNGQNLKNVRHEIVPEVSYSYLPERSQQHLPFYDYTDRTVWQNQLGFSLTSLLNGKFVSGETSEYREISRVKLMLGYSIEGNRRDLLTLVDTQRPWSDLILESDTWLNRNVRLTFDTRYNLYDNRLSTVALGVEADDLQGNSIGAGYQMARDRLEYLEGRLATKLLRPFYLSYTARYSFDRGDFLESVYSAEYRHKCWSVNAAIHQRVGGNQSYTLNFNLAGLGNR